MSGIVRAVHQSSSKHGDIPLARLDLFESLPSRRFGCRASTTNSTAKSRSTSLYRRLTSSRGGCRALQLYSALHLYSSTALYTLHPLHPPSGREQGRPGDWGAGADGIGRRGNVGKRHEEGGDLNRLCSMEDPSPEKKIDILTFLPPSETGDSHTPVSDQGECPPPPLARLRRIACPDSGDT